MKITKEAAAKVQTLRTRYPWAVANNDQIVIDVFNYKTEAVAFAAKDKANRVAFDASGVCFDVVANP